jgi:hypothetical protein
MERGNAELKYQIASISIARRYGSAPSWSNDTLRSNSNSSRCVKIASRYRLDALMIFPFEGSNVFLAIRTDSATHALPAVF